MSLWIAAYLFYLEEGGGRNLAIFLRYDDNDDFVTRLYQCQMKITRSIHRLMRLMQIDAITACYLVIFLPSYGPIHIDYRHNPPLRYNSLKLSRYVPEFPRVFPRITAFFFRWERSLFLSSIDRSSHLMIAVYRVTVNHMPLHRRDDDTNLLDLWENA